MLGCDSYRSDVRSCLLLRLPWLCLLWCGGHYSADPASADWQLTRSNACCLLTAIIGTHVVNGLLCCKDASCRIWKLVVGWFQYFDFNMMLIHDFSRILWHWYSIDLILLISRLIKSSLVPFVVYICLVVCEFTVWRQWWCCWPPCRLLATAESANGVVSMCYLICYSYVSSRFNDRLNCLIHRHWLNTSNKGPCSSCLLLRSH